MSNFSSIIFIVWITVILAMSWANNSSDPWTVIIGLIATDAAIIGIWFLLKPRSIQAVRKSVCDKLHEHGYNYKIEEDVLSVIRSGAWFNIHFWDQPDSHIKRLYFVYNFGDPNYDKVSREGWSLAANLINIDNPHITFTAYNNGFSCRFETSIRSSKSFITEFDEAYDKIGNAIEEYKNIYPDLEREYPNLSTENKAGIGFK